MKDAILGAAIEVVALHGLNNWTVEEVANRARCAKGLVNYHYRSKQDLLVQVAETIRAFTPGTQLARVFRYHQEIQDARGLAAAAPTY